LSNPTTPFGWQMPTATDLVTDLPADFEVFGQAVATSMADLLGGTSGQVLAKNSNTDMDFVWVTSDDANAIQNTIVDAKGDLIAATAADTPARLAVGANDTMLVADSTAATGLTYKSATTLYPWQTWAVTLTNITVGNGVVSSRYQQIGKLVNFELNFTMGSTSAMGTTPYFNLPVAAKQSTGFMTLQIGDVGATAYQGGADLNSTIGYLFVSNTTGTYLFANYFTATVPMTWVTNDFFTLRGTYEAA